MGTNLTIDKEVHDQVFRGNRLMLSEVTTYFGNDTRMTSTFVFNTVGNLAYCSSIRERRVNRSEFHIELDSTLDEYGILKEDRLTRVGSEGSTNGVGVGVSFFSY